MSSFGGGNGGSNVAFSTNGYDFYNSPDYAAMAWALRYGQLGAGTSKTEYSSLIFEVSYEGGKYYAFTDPVAFGKKEDSEISSPGPEDKLHGNLPTGATLYGHIHLHWEGSEEGGVGRKSNVGFSEPFGPKKGDQGVIAMSKYKDLDFYVLGSTGTLLVHTGEKRAYSDSRVNNPVREWALLTNIYTGKAQRTYATKDVPNSDLRPCYIHSIKRR